jgi:extracellular factor (EF) 3-hydroxypalmitic acid methyl ester biosynthesis protein
LEFAPASADSSDVANNRLQYLTPDDWTLINAHTRRRSFRLGEEIVRQGSLGDRIYFLRNGEASVELAGTKTRAMVAWLGPDDICGDMSFLEIGTATAAVIAKTDPVETDEITWQDLRELFDAFPRLASRFYHSLAVILARRLRETSKALAREMSNSDRKL